MNKDTVVRAYLFLCALEKCGTTLEQIDIHIAWVTHCREGGLSSAGYNIVYAAKSQGFLR